MRPRRVWCHRCGQLELVLFGRVGPHPEPGRSLRPCPGSLDPVGDCPRCGRPVVVFLGAVLPHPRRGPECSGTGREPLRVAAPRAAPGAHRPESARCPACGLDGIPVSGGRLAAHGWHRGQRLDGPLDPDGNPTPGEWVGGCSNREP